MFILLFAAACTSDSATPVVNDALDQAEAATGVPRDLLAATAWAMSRLDQREGELNRENGIGVMNLREDGAYPALAEGARLAGVSEGQATDELGANLLAGAAVLAARGEFESGRTGEPVDTLEEWFPVVAAFSGAEDPLVAGGFADQVYDVLQRGLAITTDAGELVEIGAQPMMWRRELARGSGLANKWVPASTSNYTDGSRASVDRVVIHTTQGSYSGTVSWLQNPASSVSAHYVVRSSDGEITQMVQEEDTAWHAGHWDTNVRSIGIEHEGYVDDPGKWYTDAMVRASAALTRDICDRYGIPKDRAHVIAHSEVPGCSSPGGGGSACHTDPGAGWDWTYYMSLVTGSGSGSGSLGGTGLADGRFGGQFKATLSASSIGESDTCEGELDGAASGGQLYLNGNCRLAKHPDASGDTKVTWTGTAAGDKLSGTMVADGRSVSWSGTINADGSIAATFKGSKDVGGDVGVLGYDVQLSAKP
ncbi:MAG: N-acetylmuramoyl-L-alanine amidase [Myxococcales bacterium]|nr:N-acetylmuramoyl-L-alanine amidase [Myxococcales bacterium]